MDFEERQEKSSVEMNWEQSRMLDYLRRSPEGQREKLSVAMEEGTLSSSR